MPLVYFTIFFIGIMAFAKFYPMAFYAFFDMITNRRDLNPSIARNEAFLIINRDKTKNRLEVDRTMYFTDKEYPCTIYLGPITISVEVPDTNFVDTYIVARPAASLERVMTIYEAFGEQALWDDKYFAKLYKPYLLKHSQSISDTKVTEPEFEELGVAKIVFHSCERKIITD